MIIRFGCANFRSIWEYQSVSFAATEVAGPTNGLIEPSPGNQNLLVPAVVIYGANASGKSNFVNALGYMRSMILNSHRRQGPTDGVMREPFKLTPNGNEVPSKFDIDFYHEKIRYHYGFKCTDNAFVEEWLYAVSSGRRQFLFERTNESTVRMRRGFGFGRSTKIISNMMRPNSLFLSLAAQNNHELLGSIHNYFSEMNYFSKRPSENSIAQRIMRKDMAGSISEFIENIDRSIESIFVIKSREIDENNKLLHSDLLNLIAKRLNANSVDFDSINRDRFSLNVGHRTASGDVVHFDFDDESDGTKRLIALLSRLYAADRSGNLLVVDELERSFHTLIAAKILYIFQDGDRNERGSQILATTHDTNILRARFLRKDQIWFCEKDRMGSTHIFPLTDFSTELIDDIEKGYLQGRFGAIPLGCTDLLSDYEGN